MSLIIGLILTAFVLFFFEIFLPGGVLAVVGGLFLLAGSGVAYVELGPAWAVAIFCLGLISAFVMFFLEIRFISKTRFGEQLSLKSAISTNLKSWSDENLAGSEGVTLTTLAPSGKVEVSGSIHTATAQSGFLEKGTPIRVIRNETFKLIVEKI
ncbi:MAG TPA: NfeD family protein [Oceanipulchritudo sp.]|nr:NfeD family protein [Oceanipulchritudo sp.]